MSSETVIEDMVTPALSKLAAREVSVFWLRKNRKRCTQSSMSDRAVRRDCLCAIVGPGPVAGREAPARPPRLSGPPTQSSHPPSCVSARVVTLRRVVLRWRRDAVGAEGAALMLRGCGSCGCGDDGARLW